MPELDTRVLSMLQQRQTGNVIIEAGSLIQAGRSKLLVVIEANGFYWKFYSITRT